MKAPERPIGAVGPCYICGEMGHLKRSCAKMASTPGRRYPGNVHLNVEGTIVSGVKGDDVCSNEFEFGAVSNVGSTHEQRVVVDTEGVGEVKPNDGRELVAGGSL